MRLRHGRSRMTCHPSKTWCPTGMIPVATTQVRLSSTAPPIGWISVGPRVGVGITDCGFWPSGGDRQDLRFAAVDVAGHVSAWTEIGTIEIPSREEAQLADDARREAAARHNIQGPHACSMPPSLGRARSASGACLMFGLGLAIVARRRVGARHAARGCP